MVNSEPTLNKAGSTGTKRAIRTVVPLFTAFHFIMKMGLTADDKRNLRLGGIVSVYGISFAIEKWFIVIGRAQPDWEWLLIYGGLAILCTYWWIDDFIRDLWERYHPADRDGTSP